MPMRPSSDRPVNDPLSRVGYVQKATIDDNPRRVLMAFPGYGRQPAENHDEAAHGMRRRAGWHQEAGVWHIDTPQSGAVESPIPYELLTGGRLASAGNPAAGYPITAGAFGDPFADPVQRPIYAASDAIKAIAWHPSGRAVALWTANRGTDTDDFIDTYEWVPGQGFGRKYLTLSLPDVQTASSVFVRGGDFSQMAFSPDGNYLLLAGNNSTSTLVAFRFGLANGYDWQHPIDSGASDLVESCAWSPDGAYAAIGFTFTPFASVFPFTADPGATFGARVDLPTPPFGGAVTVTGVRWNPAGDYFFVVADNFPYLAAWPWSGGAFGTEVDPATTPTDEVHDITISPDGAYVAVAVTFNQEILIYPFSGGAFGAPVSVDCSAFGDVIGVSFSPDGAYLAATSWDSPFVRVWPFSAGTVGSPLADPATVATTGPNYNNSPIVWRPS